MFFGLIRVEGAAGDDHTDVAGGAFDVSGVAAVEDDGDVVGFEARSQEEEGGACDAVGGACGVYGEVVGDEACGGAGGAVLEGGAVA